MNRTASAACPQSPDGRVPPVVQSAPLSSRAMEGANVLAEVLLLAIVFTVVCASLGWHSRRYS